MARAKKVSILQSRVSLDRDNREVNIDVLDEGTGEIIETVNLYDKMKGLVESISEPIVDVTLKEYKPKGTSNRKGQYKFICPSCKSVIKSKSDNLNIICGDCEEKFELQVEE